MKKIVITSKNPVKLSCVKNVFSKVLNEQDIEYIALDLDKDGVEPIGKENIIRQMNTAISQARIEVNNANYYICMEGGMEDDGNTMNETAYVIISDESNNQEHSSCSSFHVPNEIAQDVRGGKPFAESVNKFFKTHNTKNGKGFVNILTNGLIDKEQHYAQPLIICLSAMLKSEWYK